MLPLQIFAVGTIAGFAINSVVPVYFELSIEATFPLPEATVVMVGGRLRDGGCRCVGAAHDAACLPRARLQVMTLVNNTGTL